MGTVSLKQARERLSHLVDAAERGESVVITRRGKNAAKLGPMENAALERLPDLSEFRSTLGVRGKKLSRTVVAQRKAERY
ncbi:MAG: type II toxin-antitoxin system prevent-host-death family antitoxin [Deltaproteobacteria bacterium]|nr:type II toxin-antitoxin system prevent-host-death family antitoxin [Deltaproteobacteria bacterium]